MIKQLEILQSMTELKINIEKITYDKKSKVLAIELPGFTFVGNYNKNTRISIILNDIHKILNEKGINIERQDIDFIDKNTLQSIHGNTKLKKIFKSQEKNRFHFFSILDYRKFCNELFK